MILDKPATATGNPTLTFINHRGFVKRVIVNATSTNPPTITVQNTVNSDPPISKDIVSGTQFTATSNSDDRQLCCPPTDTSPPFTATEEGLNTDTVAPRPNLRFENGNLVFDELLIQVNSSSNNAEDSDTYPSAQINRKIDIRSTTANKTYKILAATS